MREMSVPDDRDHLFRSMATRAGRGAEGAIETIRIVDDAIEDRIGEGRLADDVVPFVERKLVGNQS